MTLRLNSLGIFRLSEYFFFLIYFSRSVRNWVNIISTWAQIKKSENRASVECVGYRDGVESEWHMYTKTTIIDEINDVNKFIFYFFYSILSLTPSVLEWECARVMPSAYVVNNSLACSTRISWSLVFTLVVFNYFFSTSFFSFFHISFASFSL